MYHRKLTKFFLKFNTYMFLNYTHYCVKYDTYIVLFKNCNIYCVEIDKIRGCRFLTTIMFHIEHNMCHFLHIRFYSVILSRYKT